jgi:hypothetical protein
VKCLLKIGNKLIDAHTVIDCGGTGKAFVYKDFVHHHKLKVKELRESGQLEVIDGRPNESETILTMGKLNLGIRSHKEHLPVFVTKLGHYSIMLQLPWEQLYDITIKF